MYKRQTEISKQVFPVTLDLDNPVFLAGLQRLLRISRSMTETKRQFGLGGMLKRVGLTAAAAVTLGRLFFLLSLIHISFEHKPGPRARFVNGVAKARCPAG